MKKKAGQFSFSVLAPHLLWPGMTSALADHYHSKVTHRHYLLLLTDRDSGHYLLPLPCLNSCSTLLSGGVVGFWLEGKRNFRQQKSGAKTWFYTYNRPVAEGEIVAAKVT